ncbi:unnamed protein product [Acanthoscelides obtectus]|uniref:MADF domain-containing protein n=1 Tax=Acanthoscelides obtectus TaxID=200917 RepID=A0A9P0LK48_ACAOB|nr:unnamed protein product [Acanthoscelides obtectus]CAK1644837.1 hypothetical protein AOBTE_LOCUS13954 [Acanthoscelides obtectus]
MSDLRMYTKQFLTEFIHLYKSFPCLWKTKSSEYNDRNKKNQAYMELVYKLQEVEPETTINSVKRKIDSLRGSFRKELRKVNASRKLTGNNDDIYLPKLWYFKELLFLTNYMGPRKTESDPLCQEDTIQEETLTLEYPETIDIKFDPPVFSHPNSPSPSEYSISNSGIKRKRNAEDLLDEVVEKINRKLDNEDRFDVAGKHIANKLRDLSKESALVAEKFISDILFEAALGNISRYTEMSLTSVPQQEII